MGHPNVKILDGQLAKWKKEEKPCESSEVADTDFSYAYDSNVFHNYEDIVNITKDTDSKIIDVRPADDFAKGSISGSLNMPVINFFVIW